MKGKTVDRVEFGFAEQTEGAHRSELLIIHFTDGSIMSIDTHMNAGKFKPTDFDVSYLLHWVPPK
jgi:type VI protein secretion system component Hcp